MELPGDPREPGELLHFTAETESIFPENIVVDNNDRLCLVAIASKFGVIFVANRNYVNVFYTEELVDRKVKNAISVITISGEITEIAVNCDGRILFIVAVVDNCPFGYFYDIPHLIQKANDSTSFYSLPLSSVVGTRVVSLAWNPCDPVCLSLAISSGDLCLIRVKDNSVDFTNKNGIGASSVTWSAKGKQLAVGMKNSTMSLFKPDLTHVRSIDAPPINGVGPVIDITWFTNTEFFVGFLTPHNIPNLVYVNAPKGKPAMFVNFEDVCYSTARENAVSYYTVFIAEWSLLLVFSSNGVEMGVLGKTEIEVPGKCNWCQWFPDDSARASMQFFNVVEETFPFGLAIDFTSQKLFPVNDETVKGPFPFLCTISNRGILNLFFVENRIPNLPQLTTQREVISTSGVRTPEQYGRSPRKPQNFAIPSLPTSINQPTIQPNLANFSFSPKSSGTGLTSVTPFSFSTPIKPQQPPSSSLFSSPMAAHIATTAAAASISLFSPPVSSTKAAPQPPPSFGTISLPNSSTKGAQPPPFGSLIPSISSTKTAAPPPFGSLPPSSTFSFTPLATPSTTKLIPSPQSSSTPISISNQQPKAVLPAPSPQKSAPTNEPLRSPTVVQVPKPVSVPSVLTGDLKTSPTTSKISKEAVLQHILKEDQRFEKQFLEHVNQNNSFSYEIGSNEENKNIQDIIRDLCVWMKDMNKTTGAQNDEVDELHQKTLKSLATYEDANSHRHIEESPRNQMYLELRPLDPYSQRQLDNIRSKYQYLVSQIGEVNSKMEDIWQQHRTARKPHSFIRELKLTTENLYRSVLNLHNKRIVSEKQLDEIIGLLKRISFDSDALPSPSLNVSSERRILSNISSNLEHSNITPQKSTPTNKMESIKRILSQRTHTPVRIQPSFTQDLTASSDTKPDLSRQKLVFTEESLLKTPEVKPKISPAVVYEDISPPSVESKSAAVPSITSQNPLAALSSLVGSAFSNIAKSPGSSSTGQLGSFPVPVAKPLMKTELPLPPTSPLADKSTSQSLTAIPELKLTKPLNQGSVANLSGDMNLKGFTSLSAVPKGSAENLSVVVSRVAVPVATPLALANSNALGTPITSVSSASFSFSNASSAFKSFSTFTSASPSSIKTELGGISPIKASSESSKTSTQLSCQSSNVSGSLFSGSVFTTKTSVSNSSGSIQAGTPFTFNLAVSTSAMAPARTDHSFVKCSNENSALIVAGKPEALFAVTATPVIFGQSVVPSTSSLFSSSVVTSTKPISPVTSLSHIGLISKSTAVATRENITLTTGSQASVTLSTLPIATSLASGSLTKETPTNLVMSCSVITTANSIFGKPSTDGFSLLGSVPVVSTISVTSQLSLSQESKPQFSFSTTSGSPSLCGIAPVSSSASPTVSTPSKEINKSSALSIFGNSSIFSLGSQGSSSIFGTPSTSTLGSSLLGLPANSTFATESTFGQVLSTSGSQTLVQSGISLTTTTSTVFGTVSASPSLFGSNASSSSIFSGSFSSPSISNSNNIFKQVTAVSSAVDQSPIFGSASSTSMTPSIFGKPQASSIFGAATSASSKTSSTLSAPQSSSIFGSPQTTSSIFGAPQTTSSIFGSPQTTSSIFGSSQTTSSIFSSAQTTSSVFASFQTTSSIFGSSQATSLAFGVQQSAATQSSTSIFGGAVQTTPSIFGTPKSTVSSFGAPQTSTTTIFGTPKTTVFGVTQASSVFGAPQPSTGFGVSQPPSIFGGQQSTPPFGGGSVLQPFAFGATSPASQPSPFGVASTSVSQTPSLFGAASSGTQGVSSPFGANNAAVSSPFSSGSMLFGGLGKSPSAENASKNVFGSVTGVAVSQPNLFGGSGSSPFGSPAASNPGTFSPVQSSTSSVFGNKSTFGSSPSFGANKPAFGGGAVFGSSPSFGGGAPFGGSPSLGGDGAGSPSVFGGKSSFGSPSGTMGGGGFGSFSGGSTFGSIAKQPGSGDGSSFGQIAQQGSNMGSSAFNAGSSSFNTWR